MTTYRYYVCDLDRGTFELQPEFPFAIRPPFDGVDEIRLVDYRLEGGSLRSTDYLTRFRTFASGAAVDLSLDWPQIASHPTPILEYEDQHAKTSIRSVISLHRPVGLLAEMRRVEDSFEQWVMNYCDSSIWHYLLQSDTDYDRAMRQVEMNAKSHRYQLDVAREYLEFNARKLRASYIIGNHANGVFPFISHSERDIHNLTVRQGEKEVAIGEALASLLTSYHWRFLLIDDNATGGLSACNGERVGKVDIIRDNIIRACGGKALENVDIECIAQLDEAQARLREGRRYDIILLDYKLDRKKARRGEAPVNYGSELLVDIKTGQYTPSPCGKYYFLFISGYPVAVQEDLMARKIYSDTEHWFIRRGACPTNTPSLFLYELYRIMQKRLDELQHHIKEIRLGSGQDLPPRSATVTDFVRWLYGDAGRARDRAQRNMSALLTLRATYDKLKYDVKPADNASPLISHMFPDIEKIDNTFWEHLFHLVYLTAYGTNRQWPEMWEEQVVLRRYWSSSDPSGLVRDYILSVKS